MPNGVKLRPGSFARDPASALHAQPIGGAVMVFVALAAIAWAKRGTQPDQEQLIAFAVAAAAVALVAQLGQQLLTWAALAAVALAVFNDPDAIGRTVRQVRAQVGVA